MFSQIFSTSLCRGCWPLSRQFWKWVKGMLLVHRMLVKGLWFNSLPIRTHSYAVLKTCNFFFSLTMSPTVQVSMSSLTMMLTVFWNAEIDGRFYRRINGIWFVLFALCFHAPSIRVPCSYQTEWLWKVHRHFTKFTHLLFWTFAILVPTSRFTGVTAVGTVLTFSFLCGLLFSSTLGNLTFCKNRVTFEIVSLPCLLLCYHSVQLHSHCVYVVKIASSLPMPFSCLPAHSPEMDSLTNTKGCSFSALC